MTHDPSDNLSRRGFVVRASQLGALTVLGPAVGHELSAMLPHTAPHRAGIPDLYSGLRWRMLGPFRGGRVAAATGVVGRPNEFYFGSVNGGVWKSIDAGRVWKPVFDLTQQPPRQPSAPKPTVRNRSVLNSRV